MTRTTEARAKLAADFGEVMKDIESLLAATTQQTGEEAAALRARIADRLATAKAQVADAQEQAAEHARRAADSTNDYVHEHPWQAIGLAAAVGLVVGVLIGRR